MPYSKPLEDISYPARAPDRPRRAESPQPRRRRRRRRAPMSDVFMPRLSDTMEEGTILRWIKGDGDQVRRGDELVEIETDKAAMTYESDSEGVLQTLAAEGDTLPIGQVIARIGARRGRRIRRRRPVCRWQGEHCRGSSRNGRWGRGTRVPNGRDARAGERERSRVGPRGRARRGARQGLPPRTPHRSRAGLRPALAQRHRARRANRAGRPAGLRRASRRPGAHPRRRRGGGARAPSRAPRPSPADVSTAKGTTTIVELSAPSRRSPAGWPSPRPPFPTSASRPRSTWRSASSSAPRSSA